MSDSKRTQLFMDRADYRKLQELARQRGESVGFLVREAVADYLRRQDPLALSDRDSLWSLADTAVAGGPIDGAAELDHYLYEKPKSPSALRRPRKGLRR